MSMLTLVAVIGTIIVVVGVGVALGLAPEDEPASAVKPAPAEATPSTFFITEPRIETQMEILLARLDQHVRQERAAVEMFHDEPSAASLRRNTSSPLAN